MGNDRRIKFEDEINATVIWTIGETSMFKWISMQMQRSKEFPS